MNRIKKIVWVSALGLLFVAVSTAQIPDEYMANAESQAKYDKIVNELFVEIQAKSQIGQPISTTVFSELNQLFSDIIPHLPNKYSFNIIYQQCLTLSQTLSNGYNINMLASFMDNCFKPFVKTVDEINKDYTVKPSWSISPTTWPAPLSVTLDARASIDPSNQTIPNNNFYRYYRDVAGVDRTIGIGNVLNYTFEEPGLYTVHLTVRSSNKTTQGIVDGSQIFSVDVTPRSANIVAFANGQRLKTTEKVKLWLQEGQRGIVLDGSTTTARWWRILTNHRRDITWPGWFQATRAAEGVPSTLRIVLPDQWEYSVTLTVFDNQNNQLSEKFSIAISDPVSIIKQVPEVGNTSVMYTFDGSTSYSITSRLRLHTWEIFDTNGNRLDTFQWKSINKQFSRPWSYVVRLTVVDEEGNENIEPRQVFVESTPPVAQFLSTPTPDVLHPSEFVLDAWVSSDIDVTNGFDSLTYRWDFSSPTTEIVESTDGGKTVRVLFNEVWKHMVKLTVVDQYGKSSTIEKEFDIKSTIRPKIFVNPTATARGNQINFVAQTNKNVLWYERDFGNGTKRTVQERNTSVIYQMIGVYKVTLKVNNGSEQNEVTSLVFIGEKESPIPWYRVENPALWLTVIQNDVCEDQIQGETVQIPAYRVDRYKEIRINGTASVNVKWEKNNLKMFFQPRNDQIFRDVSGSFNYKFNELWCQFVNFTVEDDVVGKNSAVKIRFKVVNALPTLDNIVLSYPQFGNDSGIGFQQAAGVQQEVFTAEFDPLIVKVTATNPRDTDGSLSYFQWYYYDKNDPGRILWTKLSPGDVPYTFFSLPKTPGEFAFGVKMYDNDWWNQRSEDIIGNGPVVFFPPDTNRPDIPIVTLRTNKTNVEVGEEITFDVVARVLSDRPDFIQERVIQIDFDGDGEYDLTTKSDRITYSYTKPSEEWYVPKASVLYRWYRGVAKWENIMVKNGLKPRLLFDSVGTLLLVRDVSIGEIENQSICMDATACDNPTYVRTERDAGFIFTYPQAGKYVVSMDVIDKNANSAAQRRPLDMQENQDLLQIASIPEASNINSIPEIFVGKNLDNAVLFYMKYNNPSGVCYVDTNIKLDSNKDGNNEQDQDFMCNTIHLASFGSNYENITGRIYYEEGWSLQTQDFVVSFLDFSLELDEKTKQAYELINEIIGSIDPTLTNNQFLVDQLVALKESVLDKADVSAVIVSIQDSLNTQNLTLSTNEKEKIDTLIQLFQNKASAAAMGWTVYDQAKAEILSILPKNTRSEVLLLFSDFENAVGTPERTLQEIQKDLLQEIGVVIGRNVAANSNDIQADQIDPTDMEAIVIPNICLITGFYNIPTDTCTYDNEEIKPIPTDISQEVGGSGWLASWIKILLIILVVFVVWFIGLVVVFAIKAKIKWSSTDEEQDDEYIVPQEVVNPPAQQPEPQPQTPPEQETESTQ